jgi:transcriptional regulator with XRE-family HTH domain
MSEARDTRIGAAIAGLRRERGWSQRALAEVLGLARSAVSRIETGKRGMAPAELEAFAQALGVPATSLLDAWKTPSATRPPPSATRRGAGRLDREALLLAVDDADAVYQRIHARRSGVAGPLFPSRDADRATLPQAATEAAPDGATLPGGDRRLVHAARPRRAAAPAFGAQPAVARGDAARPQRPILASGTWHRDGRPGP